MSSRRFESAAEQAVAWSPVSRVVSPRRAVRFAEFCGVGASGMVLDLTVTLLLIDHVHYLLANAAGFALAVSWNFGGNWWLTFDTPEGSLPRQYASYVSLHTTTFAIRAGAIFALVSLLGTPMKAATAVGIGAAVVANYLGTERILGGDRRIWFDAVEAVNHLAHAVYSSRLRGWLLASGLYNPLFRAYTMGLALVYRAPEREIHVNGASATLATEEPTEIVSVLHTLEKERSVLEQFVDDVQPGDRVLDVGANVGVFSALAEDVVADITAVEPHPPTASRLRENIDGRVVEAALGSSVGTVQLAVTNDAPGTQRPEVAESGERTVPQLPADRLGAFDIVKIDVEGAESDVLDGLERALADVRTVFVEAHSPVEGESLQTRLRGAGFDVETLAENEQVYLRGER